MFSSTAQISPSRLGQLWPGLVFCAALAGLGFALTDVPWAPPMLSPMVVAMMLGMALRNSVILPESLGPGIALSLKPLLRLGIVLLGFRLTLGDIAAVGVLRLSLIAAVLFASFFVIRRVGALLGVERSLSTLIAAGTSVCGASAILGVNAVAKGSDEDVAYAIATVTLFGTLAMVLWPVIAMLSAMTPEVYGYWTGATLHEVAQAVGAGFALGEDAGQAATVAKLSRVILLAPLILLIGRGEASAGGKAPTPWFVFGFLAVVCLNSAVPLPEALVEALTLTSAFLLTMALAAMGLGADVSRLALKGFRPLALGAFGWVFIATTGAAAMMLI